MKTIAAFFDHPEDADAVIEELNFRGIDKNQISVIAHERAVPPRSVSAPAAPVEKAMTLGVTGGAALGGLGGFLIGAGALAIPGIGPVLAAGTLAAALTGGAVGTGVGMLTGGLAGALVGWELSEDEARLYAEGVRQGGILLAVQVHEEAVPQIRAVLHDARAVNIEVLRQRLQTNA